MLPNMTCDEELSHHSLFFAILIPLLTKNKLKANIEFTELHFSRKIFMLSNLKCLLPNIQNFGLIFNTLIRIVRIDFIFLKNYTTSFSGYTV